jgi:hypothetical protein
MAKLKRPEIFCSVAGGADSGDTEYFEEKISELEAENSQMNEERMVRGFLVLQP